MKLFSHCWKQSLVVLLFFILPQSVFAATVYVNTAATGSNNGTSWANAYTTLISALANAQSSDQIWVAKGTYYPSSDSDRSDSFTLGVSNGTTVVGIEVYGGFNGTETALSQRDWETNTTILSGDIQQDGNSKNNSYHVVIAVDNAVLDGFTISDGYAGGGGTTSSCATGTTEGSTNPSDVACGLGNSTGGGMANYQQAAVVRNCIFEDNYALKGGAVYNVALTGTDGNLDASALMPYFENVTFQNNSANLRGGAMSNDLQTSPVLVNTRFFNNSTNAKGGGIYNDFGADPQLYNCLFTSNSARRGGALANDGGSQPTLVNCTIVSNTATDLAGGLYQGSYSWSDDSNTNKPTLINTILYGNTSSSNGPGNWVQWHITDFDLTTSLIEGGYYDDSQVIDADPSLDSSYQLQGGSPAIGSGTTTSFIPANSRLNLPTTAKSDTEDKLATDIDGNVRSTFDLGAFAYSSSSSPLGGASTDEEEPATTTSNALSGQLAAGNAVETDKLLEVTDSVHGNAIVLGTDTSLATKFKAGISVNNTAPTLTAKANVKQPFILNSVIEVDPAHVGQKADLVMVVGAEMAAPFEGDEDTVYAAVNEQDEFVHIDLYQPQAQWGNLLVPFKTDVTLESKMTLTPRQSQFEMAGRYYFFVGYRLANGNIVYNPKPISLEVAAESVEVTIPIGGTDSGLAGSSTTSDPTVCVYQHSNYSGWEKCYTTSQSSFVSLGINDAVSSIKVSNGAIAVLYNDTSYGGTSYVYDASSTSVTANDAASSLKIFDSSSPVACVYQNSSYGGWGVCMDSNTSDFTTLSIDNAVSSIKLHGDAIAVLYNAPSYTGTGYAYDTNSSSVTADNLASSIKIFDSNEPVACVYQHSDYSGWGICLDADTSSLGAIDINDAVSSVKVFGDAIAVLYKDASYSGTSYVYDENTSSVDSHDTASSVKIFDSNDAVACVYQHVSYGGWGVCMDADTSSFGAISINDAVSSVKVHGDAVVTLYKDASYSGSSSIYSYDVASVEYNDAYSSLKITDGVTITQLDVDGQSGNELVVKILNPDGSGYLVYEPMAVAHFLKSHGISIDETFVNALSTTQRTALINQNTQVSANTSCLSGITTASSSGEIATLTNTSLGTSSDGVTASASGTYGANYFETEASLTTSGLSLSYSSECSITVSNGVTTLTVAAGGTANAEFSVSKNGYAIGASASYASVTYTIGDTDESYFSLSAEAGVGASFSEKWGQDGQYGFSISALCCGVAVYVSGSDATTAYNESKEWILDTSGTVVNTTEATSTYVWNQSSDWAKNASGDIQVFYHNGVDDIEVGYKKVSSTITLWVSDATGTVSMTLVNSASAISTALSQVGSTMSSTTTAVTTTLSSWAKSTTSVVSKVANSMSDTLESVWSTISPWLL